MGGKTQVLVTKPPKVLRKGTESLHCHGNEAIYNEKAVQVTYLYLCQFLSFAPTLQQIIALHQVMLTLKGQVTAQLRARSSSNRAAAWCKLCSHVHLLVLLHSQKHISKSGDKLFL